MSPIHQDALHDAIRAYRDPYLHEDLFSLNAVRGVDVQGNRVQITIELPYACEGIKGAMRQLITTQVEDVDGVEDVVVDITSSIPVGQTMNKAGQVAGVKNIIAVASGKGGVGKSTSTVNLALALAAEGAKVGILDADIYGPSMGMMLGVAEGTRPKTEGNQYFYPVETKGLQAMSMAFLVTDKTPMVWRGPMVSGALQQLLNQTKWDNLDYLVIDMPPGTGDIQLTLSQTVPVTASVIVTTPQDIALLDCKKGIEMFRKVNIPVLGVIENMSVHICSQCGHEESLFGEGGGDRIAQEYGVEVLGKMPLHKTIREQTDAGTPTVIAEPDSEVAHLYRDMARKVGAMLYRQSLAETSGPTISFSDD